MLERGCWSIAFASERGLPCALLEAIFPPDDTQCYLDCQEDNYPKRKGGAVVRQGETMLGR